MSRAMEKATANSTTPSASLEQLKSIDETLRVLIDTLKSQSARITKLEDAQASILLAISSTSSSSKDSELASLGNDMNAIVSTLNKQSETLSALAETVSDKRVVKQSDGSVVSASELQAHSMMKELSAQMTTLSSTSEKLAKEVHAKSSVKLDGEKTGRWFAKQVAEHFDQAVEVPVKALRKDLEDYRSEVSTLGSEKLVELKREVDESISELQRAERRLESIERRVTFVGIGRLALAVLPLFAALILVGGLVWGLGEIVGVGPLFGWAWDAFSVASVWWQKGLIAVGTLGGAAVFVWGVLRLAQWIYDELR